MLRQIMVTILKLNQLTFNIRKKNSFLSTKILNNAVAYFVRTVLPISTKVFPELIIPLYLKSVIITSFSRYNSALK